ncbi:DUF378 domain-containing protein [bacterium]|nr:DUF378 domain-containing protein [bacterium]
MSWFDWVTFVVVIIGALNWGLVGLLNFDLVSSIFGQMTFLARSIYVIVGMAAVYMTMGMIYVASKNLNKQKKE